MLRAGARALSKMSTVILLRYIEKAGGGNVVLSLQQHLQPPQVEERQQVKTSQHLNPAQHLHRTTTMAEVTRRSSRRGSAKKPTDGEFVEVSDAC